MMAPRIPTITSRVELEALLELLAPLRSCTVNAVYGVYWFHRNPSGCGEMLSSRPVHLALLYASRDLS